MVVGNPPYNKAGTKKNGAIIWHKFVKGALSSWLADDGYLLFIHPPLWRMPSSPRGRTLGLFDLMTHKNQLHELRIVDKNAGSRLFKAGHAFDYYLIEKGVCYANTRVCNKNGSALLDMREYEWLPNDHYEKIRALTGLDCQPLLHNTRHRQGTPSEKTEINKYPLLYRMSRKYGRGITYLPKKDDQFFFGVPKVIISLTSKFAVINDFEGEYGICEHIVAFAINTEEEGDRIAEFFLSNDYAELHEAIKFSYIAVAPHTMKQLCTDFWFKYRRD